MMPQQKSAKTANISSAMASQRQPALAVFPIKAEKEADLVMEVSSSKYWPSIIHRRHTKMLTGYHLYIIDEQQQYRLQA
jgi:hypothetical protein